MTNVHAAVLRAAAFLSVLGFIDHLRNGIQHGLRAAVFLSVLGFIDHLRNGIQHGLRAAVFLSVLGFRKFR